MKVHWQKLAARINALTLRERFMLFTGILAVLAMLTYQLFISPLITQQKILVAQLDKKTSDMDLQQAETNLEMLRRGSDRAKGFAIDLVKAQADLDVIENEIANFAVVPVDAAVISTMRTQILKRADKVTLASVAQAVTEQGTAATADPNRRSSIDITLSGKYQDLVEYLSALEKTLPQARWGGVWMRSEPAPMQVTIRIVMPPVKS